MHTCAQERHKANALMKLRGAIKNKDEVIEKLKKDKVQCTPARLHIERCICVQSTTHTYTLTHGSHQHQQPPRCLVPAATALPIGRG